MGGGRRKAGHGAREIAPRAEQVGEEEALLQYNSYYSTYTHSLALFAIAWPLSVCLQQNSPGPSVRPIPFPASNRRSDRNVCLSVRRSSPCVVYPLYYTIMLCEAGGGTSEMGGEDSTFINSHVIYVYVLYVCATKHRRATALYYTSEGSGGN